MVALCCTATFAEFFFQCVLSHWYTGHVFFHDYDLFFICAVSWRIEEYILFFCMKFLNLVITQSSSWSTVLYNQIQKEDSIIGLNL
ncbi:hypothetical protein RclHR1_00060045 [Rhizophagus clarus]|uniref:Uncharacterized protein n=1 Tax=Rhizophagus clarus TaxID=94130 RepID=A0A2Z6S8C1_9GLOM|nr:hypothetical protein RclHR1_00060045 [Rhizophagus clarus]